MKIPIICAVCGKRLGEIELGYEAKPETVSHGLCKDCAEKELEKIVKSEHGKTQTRLPPL
jgi:hypothetical protein